MGGDTTLYQHLQKLSTTMNSEEAVDHILSSLWKTRRTGLRPPDKSHIQTLLGLPSLSELDPVCEWISHSLFGYLFRFSLIWLLRW